MNSQQFRHQFLQSDELEKVVEDIGFRLNIQPHVWGTLVATRDNESLILQPASYGGAYRISFFRSQPFRHMPGEYVSVKGGDAGIGDLIEVIPDLYKQFSETKSPDTLRTDTLRSRVLKVEKLVRSALSELDFVKVNVSPHSISIHISA